MPETAPTARTISPSDLQAFIDRILRACGFPEADAAKIAHLMTEADVRGSDGHGVFRIPHYVKRIRSGGMNLKPNIRVVTERKAQALLDGDNGMGHLVMSKATEIAIAKAKETGVAWVGARCSNQYAMRPFSFRSSMSKMVAANPSLHGMQAAVSHSGRRSIRSVPERLNVV